LDVVLSGLNVHDTAFLRKVFLGEYGHVLNSASHQRCECASCGIQLPKDATNFLSMSPEDKERWATAEAPWFTFGGGYTHRFNLGGGYTHRF
jgi:hypothetical protein